MYPIFIPMIIPSTGPVSVMTVVWCIIIIWLMLSWIPFVLKLITEEWDTRKQFIIWLLNSLLNPLWLFCLAIGWIINKIKELS